MKFVFTPNIRVDISDTMCMAEEVFFLLNLRTPLSNNHLEKEERKQIKNKIIK